MVNIKFNTLIALFLIFNQANISAAKTTDFMPEMFVGIDCAETSDTTETDTQPETAPVPAYIPYGHETVTICGEYQDITYDRYFDYELQDPIVIKTVIEHEYRPFVEDVSHPLPDAIASNISSDINTESSQQNITSDSTQDQQHEQHQEKKQQPYDYLSEFAQEQRRQEIQDVEEQTPHQSSPLQGFAPILGIIQTKSLSISYKELIHLKSQINDAFAERNITDPVAQQECLISNFGSDIIATAQSEYQSRPDVTNIITFFNPLDVQNASLRILETSNTYESVCDGFQVLTDQVLDNARLCELECLPHVENHIVDSLHVMRSPKNLAEFVFHTTIVDHLLTDLQSQATAVAAGEPPVWNRAYGLLTTGLVTFFTHLNPIEQAKDWSSLAVSAGSLVETIASKTINKAQEPLLDPIGTTQECLTMTADACRYLHNIAVGTCDAVTGIYYLPAEERLQRLESSYKTAGEIYKSIESQVTAEAVVKVGAKIAADFMVGKAAFKVGTYLKEIKALSRISDEVKVVARSLKSAVEEHPAFATAEGVVLKMSNGVKNTGKAIKENVVVQKIILKVANIKEFFALPFGQILNPHSLKTNYQYQGQSIYQLTKDIPGTGLKKGYFYYLDNLHKDHIEVFNKAFKVVDVYNLDGTPNDKKLEAAIYAGRTIKKIMGG